MPTKRKLSRREPRVRVIPRGILAFLLGRPYDAELHVDGRLQTFLRTRGELIDAYKAVLTPSELRRARRVAEDPSKW